MSELQQIPFNQLMFSTEDNKKVVGQSRDGERREFNEKKKPISQKLQETKQKTQHRFKQFQMWARKRKNLGFYKKYLDRVKSGLYDRYGDDAKVRENEMIDDPTIILKDVVPQYIRDVVKDTNNLYTQFLDIAKRVGNAGNEKVAIAIIEPYLKGTLVQNIKGEKIKDDIAWRKKLVQATRYKIAKILLRNGKHQVYGYTAKSITLKKKPTPNHLIVSHFVHNPNEAPQIQMVTNIFKSADSFDILADTDKKDIFNMGALSQAVLTKTVDGKIFNEIKLIKHAPGNKYERNNRMEDDKGNLNTLDDIWKGIMLSGREFLSLKNYFIECINVFYDMILRIDKLAVKSINQMLEVEATRRDDRYNQHLKLSKKRDKAIYDEHGELIGTRGDKKYGYIEDDSGPRAKSIHRQQYSNIRNLTKDLNKGRAQQ
jgi:hypothetical protein